MESPSPHLSATVATLLGAAGIPASSGEISEAVGAYPMLRAGVESLYALPEARYADPALRFRAEAVGQETDWAAPYPS